MTQLSTKGLNHVQQLQQLELINSSVLWMSQCVGGRVILTKIRVLLTLNHPVRQKDHDPITVQQFFHSYLQFIDELAHLGSKLNLFQQQVLNLQNIGPQQYNHAIYELIQYTNTQSWLLPDTNLFDVDVNLSGDGDMPYYGLVPRSLVVLDELNAPMQGLQQLWCLDTCTPKTQLMVNYCIQIILDIINCVKMSAYKANEYQQNYYKYNNAKMLDLGCNDYLHVLCIDLYQFIYGWIIGQFVYGWVTGSIFSKLNSLFLYMDTTQLDSNGNFVYQRFAWDQSQHYYLNKYPWLQQQFHNPLDYFSPYNMDVLMFILFANVPHTDKYQQLLKIRAKLKQSYELLYTYSDELQHVLIQECNIWHLVHTTRYDKYNYNQQFDSEYLQPIKARWEQDLVFRQLCATYMEVFEQPFELLQEVYHQARKQRSKGAQEEKYPDINMYEKWDTWNDWDRYREKLNISNT